MWRHVYSELHILEARSNQRFLFSLPQILRRFHLRCIQIRFFLFPQIRIKLFIILTKSHLNLTFIIRITKIEVIKVKENQNNPFIPQTFNLKSTQTKSKVMSPFHFIRVICRYSKPWDWERNGCWINVYFFLRGIETWIEWIGEICGGIATFTISTLVEVWESHSILEDESYYVGPTEDHECFIVVAFYEDV